MAEAARLGAVTKAIHRDLCEHLRGKKDKILPRLVRHMGWIWGRATCVAVAAEAAALWGELNGPQSGFRTLQDHHSILPLLLSTNQTCLQWRAGGNLQYLVSQPDQPAAAALTRYCRFAASSSGASAISSCAAIMSLASCSVSRSSCMKVSTCSSIVSQQWWWRGTYCVNESFQGNLSMNATYRSSAVACSYIL